MTARHQVRVGGRRISRIGAAPIDATPAPSVGELLRVARERKGVDLYRAERDTKIRARNLEALEDGEYSSLPGAVYTKGFLRNYALYLGLDPEEIIARWRDETSVTRRTETVPVTPPRPIAEPRRGLTFTPGIVVAALLSVVVFAFGAYVVAQFMRFSQVPTLELDGPVVRQVALGTDRTALSGTTTAGATVTVRGASDLVRTDEADAQGRWAIEVPVAPGQNDLALTVTDPSTNRESSPLRIVVQVPVPPSPTPLPSGAPSPSPALPEAQLSLSSPTEGSTSSTGVVTIAGTTDATAVTVLVESATATPAPSAAPTGAASPAPPRTEMVTVGDTGAFSDQLTLGPGRWTLTVQAEGDGLAAATETRTIEVELSGVTVVVTAQGGNAYVQVWTDGDPVPGWSPGRILRRGVSETFTADRTILIRTGNAGATLVTVNGEDLGALGGRGVVGNWLIREGEAPRRVP